MTNLFLTDPNELQEWGEMGGRVSPLEENDFAEVARRELLEETAGTVDVPYERVVTAPFIETGMFHR